MKIFLYMILFSIFLNNCSFNNSSSLWDQRELSKTENININKNINNSFENYNKDLTKYSRESEYPDINY